MLAVNCGVAMGFSLGGSATPFVGEQPAVVTGVSIHGHLQMQSAEQRGPVLFLRRHRKINEPVAAAWAGALAAFVLGKILEEVTPARQG